MATIEPVPCGSWKSPITVELISAQTLTLWQTWVDGADVYWVEGRPLEGGRNVLVRLSPGSGPVDCLPGDRNVRTRVHEYGGGAYAVFEGVIYFVEFKDQKLYRQIPGRSPELLASAQGHRFADFELDPTRKRLLCVHEDHSGQGEAVSTLVAIRLEGGGDETVLVAGCSFYSTPQLSPDGSRRAWLGWNHPNMPWNGTELWVAEVRRDGTLGAGRRSLEVQRNRSSSRSGRQRGSCISSLTGVAGGTAAACGKTSSRSAPWRPSSVSRSGASASAPTPSSLKVKCSVPTPAKVPGRWLASTRERAGWRRSRCPAAPIPTFM